MYLLNQDEVTGFSIFNQPDPGHYGESILAWVEFDPSLFPHKKQDNIEHYRISHSHNSILYEFDDPFGGSYEDFTYRSAQRGEDVGWVHVRKNPNEKNDFYKTRLFVLRIPTDRLVFSGQLTKMGISPEPGFLYFRVRPWPTREYYGQHVHEPFYPFFGYFQETQLGSGDFRYQNYYKFQKSDAYSHSFSRQGCPRYFDNYVSPINFMPMSQKRASLFDLEVVMNMQQIVDVQCENGDVLMKTPFEHAPGLLWDTSQILRAEFGEQFPKLVQSFTDIAFAKPSGSLRSKTNEKQSPPDLETIQQEIDRLSREIRRIESQADSSPSTKKSRNSKRSRGAVSEEEQDSDVAVAVAEATETDELFELQKLHTKLSQKATLVPLKMPRLTRANQIWRESPKWEWIQMILLARLIGGEFWQSVLCNLQLAADDEIDFSASF